jgi:hypothetical protein
MNVNIRDNGAAFCVTVNGMIVVAKNSLGDAWRHIQWMYEIACQDFTVGDKETPVKQWLKGMMIAGYLDMKHYSWMDED